MRLFIGGETLCADVNAASGRFVVEIEVASTLANRRVAHNPATLFDKADLASYNERAIAFERMAPACS